MSARDYGWNVAGARTPAYSGTQGAQDRTGRQYSTRHRANVQIDTRTQTQYGTLRTFTSLHFQNEDNVFSQNVARAFIQWAGFTFGHAQSFQDTWGITDSWHYAQQQNNSDTGANGVNQIAYTWELGNGITLTVGADEVRRKSRHQPVEPRRRSGSAAKRVNVVCGPELARCAHRLQGQPGVGLLGDLVRRA